MAEIIWANPALDELSSIAEHIAISNPTAARNLVQRVMKSVDRLVEFPHCGRVVPQIEPSEHRELLVDPVRVIHRVTNQTVFIVHVVRQERELRRYISQNH